MSTGKRKALAGLLSAYSDSEGEDAEPGEAGELGPAASDSDDDTGPMSLLGAIRAAGGVGLAAGEEGAQGQLSVGIGAALDGDGEPLGSPLGPPPLTEMLTSADGAVIEGEVPVAHMPMDPRRQFVSVPEKYLENVELPPAPAEAARQETQARSRLPSGIFLLCKSF